ncbi:MAG TPA: tetratricopeptide repeat protein [Rhizomicrobium sp.]
MRRACFTLGTIAILSTLTTPSFSMGGSSGGGGYSGGSGYGGLSAPTASDYSIAVRLIKHEQYADAIAHLLIALADKPTDADILNYLGYTKRMTGDFPSSLAYYQRALASKPDHRGAHEYLGELYLQMHDPASAQKELDTLASLCPDGCDERDTLSKAIAAYVPPAASN